MCKRWMEDHLGTGRVGTLLTGLCSEMCCGISGGQEGWHSSWCELLLSVRCWCCKFLQLCKETGTYPLPSPPTYKHTSAPMHRYAGPLLWILPYRLLVKRTPPQKCSKSDHKGHHPRDRQAFSQDKARSLQVSLWALSSQWDRLQRRPWIAPPISLLPTLPTRQGLKVESTGYLLTQGKGTPVSTPGWKLPPGESAIL